MRDEEKSKAQLISELQQVREELGRARSEAGTSKNQLLRLMSDSGSRKEYLDGLVALVQSWSRCSCVGVRLVNDRGAIPYESYIGFSREFWESENALLLSSDNCVCTRIIAGKPDPADAPCMTPGGSFRCEDLPRFATEIGGGSASNFRGVCIETGFQTVAVIPIRFRNRMIGAVHLADYEPGKAPDRLMGTLEADAQLMGEAIYKFRARDELRQTYETQRVIDSILRLVLEGRELQEILAESLELVLSIPGLANAGGTIFLVDEEPDVLVLKAQSGNCSEIRGNCARIPFGTCVCGRTAMTRQAHFVSCMEDASYDLRHKGTFPHGHYCVPMIFSDKVLGVINITVKQDHFYERKEEGFLAAVGNALAGVIERKRIERELKIHTSKLEQSNKDLEQFAYIASHDLNEPLRKIKVFGNMLSSKLKDSADPATIDRLMRMQDAAARMQRLLHDLLAYSRVGTRQMPFEKVSLKQIVEDVTSDLWVRINRSGGMVEMGELPEIEADPTQMRQLFQNLIANGIKFHGEKPPIVWVFPEESAENQCRICVEDNGIGFDEIYLDRIFNPFQRLHGRSEYEGTGMGLAICRRIVERHGGGITAKSTPGAGSVFIVELPVIQKKTRSN